MKNKILTILVLLICRSNYAQKIKIDKREIKPDDKTAGYLEGKKPFFTIYNLDRSYTVTTELKTAPNEASSAIEWMEIKDPSAGKLNELEFKSRKFRRL